MDAKNLTKLKKVIPAVGVAGLITLMALPVAANAATDTGRLSVSDSATRAAAKRLDGANVSGSKYIFVSGLSAATKVTFTIDRWKEDASISSVDTAAPFDFVGTSANGQVMAFDTSRLGNGSHHMRADVVRNGKTKTLHASFDVSNKTGSKPTTVTTVPKSVTTVPSSPATSSPSGIWHPAPGTTWQWQLSGTVDTSFAVAAYDIDGWDNDKAVVDKIHARGAKAICYISGGSYEDWRSDKGSFPAAVLGKGLDGWPGEKWLDVRNTNALAPIMKSRVQMCKSKGFDAVEFDNVDGYTNSTGFPLTAANQLAYNRMLAGLAHDAGMAAVLKNDVDQVAELQPSFDAALNEQCYQYKECDVYKAFVNAGKAVFIAEYKTATSSFCPQARASKYSGIKKNLDLDAKLEAC